MKVVCIKDVVKQCHLTPSGLIYELTKGKIYDVLTELDHDFLNSTYHFVICDRGFISGYEKSFFMTLSEFRKLKIEELGI